MKKINGEYTFSEAVAKVMEERKRLNALLGDRSLDDFKLPDPAECLIEELEREKKLLDKFNKLQKDYEEQGETLCKTRKKLAKKDKKYNKLSKENEELNKQIAEEKAKNDNLTKENEELRDKNKNFDKESEHEKLVESNKKVLKLANENEALHDKNDDLTNEVELLKQIVALRDEYIKFLESRSNNQKDDDNKLYHEYHTHDTFKVNNKLAEVVSVLVDKDDDVYGYEIKFEDSSDTFIVYPEEIED